MENEKKLPLSEFFLRLIGMITMTCDHIGIFLLSYGQNYTAAVVLRTIGRLAFPIFAFMLVEGMIHTHNAKRYLGRLALPLVIMLALEAIIIYAIQLTDIQGNPFIDLLLCAATIYFLKYLEEPGKKKCFALFAVLPAAYLATSFIVNAYEHAHYASSATAWFPGFLRADYSLFGLVLVLLYYYGRKAADILAKKNAEALGASLDAYKETNMYQRSANLFAMLALLVTVLVFWGASYIGMTSNGYRPYDALNMSMQSYALLVLPFLYFYNGKRGYDSKFFRWFNYLYFPMHLVLLFGIFALIFEM